MSAYSEQERTTTVSSYKGGVHVPEDAQCSPSECPGCPYKEECVRKDGFHVRVSPTVDHPEHYTSHPSGVECIDITEHFNFNIGNAIKYLWRAGLKGDAVEDLEKARWYITREIARISTEPFPANPSDSEVK